MITGETFDDFDQETVNGLSSLTVEARIVRLEHITFTHHAFGSEETSLADSISQLGVTAETLASALEQVDRNQKVLLRVRSDVDVIQSADSPSRTEVETESLRVDTQSRLDRLRVKTIAFSATIIAIAIALTTAIGLVSYTKARDEANLNMAVVSQSVCNERSLQADAMRAFITTWEINVMTKSNISDEYKTSMKAVYAKLLSAYKPVNCSKLGSQ